MTTPEPQIPYTAARCSCGAWWTGTHAYLSTGCLHGEHGYCQAKTGQTGNKKPATCKFCDAPCVCNCHREA